MLDDCKYCDDPDGFVPSEENLTDLCGKHGCVDPTDYMGVRAMKKFLHCKHCKSNKIAVRHELSVDYDEPWSEAPSERSEITKKNLDELIEMADIQIDIVFICLSCRRFLPENEVYK